MQAVILAGGSPARVIAPNVAVHKSMLPLFDRPVLEHTIKLLARHGVTDIIITVSSDARDLVEYFADGSRWGVRIRYSVEDQPMGTAGAVKTVQSMITGTFVVISGDAVTDLDIAAAVHEHKSASAIATVMTSSVEDASELGMISRDASGRITRFLEKPRASEAFSDTVSAGIYILEPDVLSCIPSDKAFDFARELFPRMINNQDPVYAFDLRGYWCDVGNPVSYRAVHTDAMLEKVKLDLPATHIGEGVWLGDGVYCDHTAEVTGPIFLGARITVGKNVWLGENSVIGEDCVIGDDTRVTRSIIGGGSRIGGNAIIDDCVMGSYSALANGEQARSRVVIEQSRYYAEPRTSPSIRKPAPPLGAPVEDQEAIRQRVA